MKLLTRSLSLDFGKGKSFPRTSSAFGTNQMPVLAVHSALKVPVTTVQPLVVNQGSRAKSCSLFTLHTVQWIWHPLPSLKTMHDCFSVNITGIPLLGDTKNGCYCFPQCEDH